FSPKECAILDPQHRHFLECCWEALEDAGHTPEKIDAPVGIFGGCGMGSYFYFNLCSNPDLVDSVGLFLLRHTGNDKDFLVTRASHVLDLRGPAVNVQTACSTSLVAVHYAVQSLLSQECDFALAGGVTIEIPHRHGYFYEEGEVLSPDGHCHAFDHRGQGTVFGSGAGIVVLRRLEDAIADRDHIYAVIRGSSVNNDGASKAGYLAPSVDGQASCIVEAHGLADVDARSIGYVECHGTGTYLGDPIELSALTEAFRQSTDETQFCRIGSVKTNIGHLDTAAGVASLIKASLVLEREQIPPSLNFEKPNPTIDFAGSPFIVNDVLTPWPRASAPRRAGIQSLGVGGTNAHVIIQEAPLRSATTKGRERQLLLVSGKNRKGLDGNAAALAEHLDATEQDLADIAWTLRVGRKEMERRRVVVGHSAEEAAVRLRGEEPRRVFSHSALDDPSVYFLFPGGGSQYVGMARGLYDEEPVFREVMDQAFAYLETKDLDFDLRALLFGDDADVLHAPVRQLPAIFAVSVAMAKLLESWGIEANAMLGHSMGEYVAACLAGVFTFEEALGLVLLRGQLIAELDEGAMSAVPLSAGELKPRLSPGVELASANAPGLSVISGPVAAVEAFEARLLEDGIEARRVPIDRAGHSAMFDPILPRFRAYLESIPFRTPTRRFVSSRTGTWIKPNEAMSPEYWVQHFRHTVEFSKALETLAAEGPGVFLEVGPGKSLGSFAKGHTFVDNQSVLPTVRHRDEEVHDGVFFLEVLGRLWALGADVPLDRLWEGETRNRVRLPTYAFQRQHYFIERQTTQGARSGPERYEDVSEFGWAPSWQPKAVAADLGDAESWLVFMDDAGVGQRVVRRLRKSGQSVIRVYPGDTFAKRSDDEYVLSPERGREGYDLLVRELLKIGRVPSRVLHLWLTTADESFRPGSSFFHRNQERGFYSLLFLFQAFADENVPRPMHATVVGNGMFALEEESLAYPEKATVLGPALVGPREFPGLTVSCLDIDLPSASSKLFGGRLAMALVDPFAGKKSVSQRLDALADEVAAEASAKGASAVAALRGGKRYERSYVQTPLARGDEPSVRDGGVYLITGGLGGLGLVAAEELARRCRAKLVLVGRSELPVREAWDAWVDEKGEDDATSRKIASIRELEGLGAEVLALSADVTNLEQMRAVAEDARARFGRVEGVFHTAGLVKDALMQVKSLPDVEEVFAPKIHGTLVLHELFADAEFLLLYSSTSTAIAPAGQVDYVAANAFMDAFAEAHPKVRAVQWGIWNQVGMAAEAFEATDRSAPPEALPPTTRPLFDGRRRDAQGRLHLFGHHGPKTHWIYDEHRVKDASAGDPRGFALIPGTGYLELAAQALSELGEPGAFTVRDLYFLRPLQIDDDETREVRVKMRRSDAGYAMEIRSACRVEGRPAWQLHAQASLDLSGSLTAPRHDLAELQKRTTAKVERGDGIRSPQEKHLSFGGRWRVLQEARYGEGEALAELRLPESAKSDLESWLLHPALMDLATGYAMDLIEGYAADHVWVPVSYEAVRVFGPLPQQVYSWVRNAADNSKDAEFALFDVDIMDAEGNVVVEVRRFAIRRIERGFAKPASPTQSDAELEADLRGEDRNLSPAEQRLKRNLERGIVPSEGADALMRVLSSSRRRVVVTSLDLAGLQEDAGRVATESGQGAKFSRPDLDSEYLEARDDVERALVGFWEELLGVENVGVQDSFFDLGGHSLIAVRLFAMVKKAFQVEFPISVLFEAPTIEACAALIKDATGFATGEEGASAAKPEQPKRRFTHLVAMHQGEAGERTPFFLVAGMFGNVLNLRHLAHLVGSDRPFYGLQAKGLYGGEAPHESFEEMADAYLAEIRMVQPEGPYMLGGFSGGGYTALEMARRLQADGEEVALLVMLDTPAALLPEPLSLKDRAEIQRQRLEQKGAGYVMEWAKNRFEWELGKLRQRFEEAETLGASEFHNEAIEAAFRRALSCYQIPTWEGRMVLFRPPLEKAYELSGGRILNYDREYVYADNGWSHHCDDVVVHEVPGDHDSMVLEPNVRVLASRLREIIGEVEGTETRAERARPRIGASL
ncbi:MAG: SDR family NAD(P)-dependent oxidoreductase, partial [Myxococcota bacterium]